MAKSTTTKKAASKPTATKKAVAKSTTTKKAAPKSTATKKAVSKSTTSNKIVAKPTKTTKAVTKVKILKKTLAEEEPLQQISETDLSNDKINEKSSNSNAKQKSEFLDNFNWHNYAEGIELIDEKQLDEFEKLVKENFVDTSDEDVLQGTVVYMTDREAIIDINAKSEGVISLNEFRYNPDLKIGDKVEVIVDTREDRTGQLVLSHRKARVIKLGIGLIMHMIILKLLVDLLNVGLRVE